MKRIVSIIMTFMLVCSCFMGCSYQNTKENPKAVAILIGNHANSKKINVNSQFVQEAVSGAVSSYGYVSIISIDGDPNIVASGSCDIQEQYKHADPQKLSSDATQRTLKILEDLTYVYADSPEVDTLEALRLAVKSLNDAPANSEKTIVILDSGVCTTGLCDFHNNIMNADAEAVADALDELQAIPNLNGIEVIWINMGEVDNPQEELSPKQINKLISIWEAIIKKGGGIPDIKDVPSTGNNTKVDLPMVSPIEIDKEMPITFNPSDKSKIENMFTEPLFLREEQVQFIADSDMLVNPDEADKVLNPIADYMKNEMNFNLLLVGTTAGDGISDYSISLSNSRAERIKQVLIDKGISESRIKTIGLGGNDPWHIYNVGTSGELAAQNRKVVLLDADSETAQELLEQ